MFKRFLSIFIALTVILCCFGFVNADESNNQSMLLSNQNEAYDNFNKLQDHYMETYGNVHPENYAGVYLDNEGNLIVNMVENETIAGGNEADLKALLKSDKVSFHKVKYSYNYLNDIINDLNDKMIELNISAIELDEQNNKVYIYLEDLNEANICEIEKVVNSPAVEFKQKLLKATTTVVELSNGTAFHDGTMSFTLGFGAKKSDGTVGYVFPGHINGAINSNVFIGSGNTSIGTITTKINSGSTDASFITKVNIDYTPSKYLGILKAYSYSGYVPVMYGYIQNTVVTEWGAVSGMESGTITSSNFSEVVDGVSRTDCVKCTYVAIHGDSGAPICITSGTGTYMLAGTQSFSNLGTNGDWIPGTSYSAFSKINNILINLGCTPTP